MWPCLQYPVSSTSPSSSIPVGVSRRTYCTVSYLPVYAMAIRVVFIPILFVCLIFTSIPGVSLGVDHNDLRQHSPRRFLVDSSSILVDPRFPRLYPACRPPHDGHCTCSHPLGHRRLLQILHRCPGGVRIIFSPSSSGMGVLSRFFVVQSLATIVTIVSSWPIYLTQRTRCQGP